MRASLFFQTLSSNLDPALVYHPPSKLQYPDNVVDQPSKESNERPESPASTSSSRSDLSSPSFNRDSEFDFPSKPPGSELDLVAPVALMGKDATGGNLENESDSNSTVTAKNTVIGSKMQRNVSDLERGSSEKRKTVSHIPILVYLNTTYILRKCKHHQLQV